MTSIRSDITSVGSEGVSRLRRGGSEDTLVADDPSNLTPTRLALYVYPDLSEATPRKVWNKWANGHRKLQHLGGVCLQAEMFTRTNPNPTDPSDHAASGHRTCMQHVKTNLLTQIQCHFDEAFNKEDKIDDKVMSCLEQAAKTAMDEFRPSQADSRIFKLVGIVPCEKVEGSQRTIAPDPTRQEGDQDEAFEFN
jgi:hypothetical protein